MAIPFENVFPELWLYVHSIVIECWSIVLHVRFSEKFVRTWDLGFCFPNIDALVRQERRYPSKLPISVSHYKSSGFKGGKYVGKIQFIVWQNLNAKPSWFPFKSTLPIRCAPKPSKGNP